MHLDLRFVPALLFVVACGSSAPTAPQGAATAGTTPSTTPAAAAETTPSTTPVATAAPASTTAPAPTTAPTTTTAPTATAAPTAPAAPAAPTASKVPLTASDVTTIWPLPVNAKQLDTMLAATSKGAHGELLPANMYPVPVLDTRDPAAKDPKADRTRLRVVAARFEPCRGSFGSPQEASCVNQIRLVMQVLRPGGGGAPAGTFGANDGAVLAFYKLTREELLALARDISALAGKHGGTASETLGVHPLLAHDGLGSEYAKQLQKTILANVGVKRLTKITFFTRTSAREPEWPFGTFTVVDGKPVRKPIPTLTSEKQTLEGTFRKAIAPVTSSPDNPDALLNVMGPARAAKENERAAYASLLRIQNPTKHNPDTMACAECHAAQQMQSAAEKTLGLRPADFVADAFTSTVMTSAAKNDAENFHAASYLGTNLSVLVRTANDTSAVLQQMITLLQ